MTTFWLRAETKEGERRTALTPAGARALIEAGARIFVEQCPSRLFSDSDYVAAGCKMVEFNSWHQAPVDHYILGLKELPVSDEPLVHRHIYFAHAFKGQDEAAQILSRYQAGGGKIFDLEFLRDAHDRRVCAFGFWAGYVGAAMAVQGYFHHAKSTLPFPAQPSYLNKGDYLTVLRQFMNTGHDEMPRVLVIGASGRCGQGAVQLFRDLGLNATTWGSADTCPGGPFPAINDYDILVNCAYLAAGTPPFVTRESLGVSPRLSLVSDVSCDPNNLDNPIRIYEAITYLPEPIIESQVPGVYVQAIDHLPTVLPKESSEDFAVQLLPHLLSLTQADADKSVWIRAEKYFQQAIQAYHSASCVQETELG